MRCLVSLQRPEDEIMKLSCGELVRSGLGSKLNLLAQHPIDDHPPLPELCPPGDQIILLAGALSWLVRTSHQQLGNLSP